MRPLDDIKKWAYSLDENARLYLHTNEYQEYRAIPDPEKLVQIKAILENPIARFTPVNEVFFRARWAEVLDTLAPGQEVTLLEIASGDADMIPQMLDRERPGSRYITANMNRILTNRLREKTKDLRVDVRVIEDDAVEIERHLSPGSVDLIAFQHAANDVIQAILCAREGVDTIDADWMDTLPEMIRILQREIAAHTLEQHARPAFLSLLAQLLEVLKSGGFIVINHYMFQLDLDWGYPPDLWEGLIPIVREWIHELPGCQEVFFDRFDPHWWIFCQKTG